MIDLTRIQQLVGPIVGILERLAAHNELLPGEREELSKSKDTLDSILEEIEHDVSKKTTWAVQANRFPS